MNPTPQGDGLKLNITEYDNALDLELAREVAGFFRVNLAAADEIIADCINSVSHWRTVAQAVGLSPKPRLN